MKKLTYALAVLVALAIVVAGCGGGSDSNSGSAYSGKGGGGGGESTQAAETSESGAKGGYGESTGVATSSSDGIVSAGKAGDLGTVLVDSRGHTLYDFHKDRGSQSACYGACPTAWPPLLTKGDPQAQGAAERSMLGTTKRKDGTVQVTYNGWPLYTYVGDKHPGEANGNDFTEFGAQWYALQPNGEEPED